MPGLHLAYSLKVLLAAFVLSVTVQSSAAAQSSSEWVYAVVESVPKIELIFSGELSTLTFYDPAAGDQPPLRTRLDIAPAFYGPISSTFLSPDRTLFTAFLADSYQERYRVIFRIFRADGSVLRDLPSGSFPIHRSWNAPLADPMVSWSPDSTILGLNSSVATGDYTTNYFVETDTLTKPLIGTGVYNSGPWHIAWRPGDFPAQFASMYYTCPTEEICSGDLRLTDAHTQLSVVVNDFSSMPLPFSNACELQWSPDGRYLAFLSSCSDVPGLPTDVFLWQPETNTITQVTHITHPFYLSNQQHVSVASIFDLFWYDNDTLFISVTQVTSGEVESETIVYHLSSASMTSLSGMMMRHWRRNPVTGQLAYRAFMPDSQNLLSREAGIQIATFAGNTLTVQANLGDGSGLDWSPDGAVLAWMRSDVSVDGQFLSTLAFYHVASGVTQHIDVSTNGRLIPVGWVRRPTISQP